MRSASWSLVAALVLLQALPAHAGDRAGARAAFTRGTQYYNLGEYKAALDAFRQAYLDYPDPTFLYNIGQCQRLLGRRADAIRSFKAYLRESDPPSRSSVEKLIAALETSLREKPEPANQPPPELPTGERPPAPPPPPATTAAAPSPSATAPPTLPAAPPPRLTTLQIIAISVGAGGLSSLAIATGLYVSARSDFDALQGPCMLRQCTPSDWDGASQKANGGYALFIIGGAMVAADAVLWGLTARKRPASARAQLLPSGLRLTF
jgi:tetratricopeptide (TPR) repeat protein